MTRPDRAVELTVVVAIHDECENLEPLLVELDEALDPAGNAVEILLVDDASRDGSAALISRLAASRSHVRAVHLREQRGQTAAFDAGFKAARGSRIVTMDGDLQNDPRDIPRLVAALDQNDVAAGYRSERRDAWPRRLASRLANAVRNRLTGDDIIDTGCSLKAFRRDCLTDLKLYRGMHRFLPTLLRMDGRRVIQLAVNHRPRHAGRSKYGIADRLFSAFADLLAVRWMKKRRLDYEIVDEE